jgi:SHO1 osmosensor
LLIYQQIVGFLAAGLVFTTSSVNSLVYSPVAPFEAAAAGYILLSMIAVSFPPTHPSHEHAS